MNNRKSPFGAAGRIVLALCILMMTLCASPARAAVQIDNIPTYGQRSGFTIPLDVNYRGVWISTLDGTAKVDCGMVSLCMIESYYAGFGSEDEYVYYSTYAARNPGVNWSGLTGDTWVTSSPWPITGYVHLDHMSPEEVLAHLNNGDPVMVYTPAPHWVVIYGYDGPTDYVDWRHFKIMSPTIDVGVQYQYLTQFVGDYDRDTLKFMYRTTGYLPNKRVAVDLGDTLQTKIRMFDGTKVVSATKDGNVELDSDKDLALQDWRLDRMGNGTYIITNLRNGQVLDLWGGGRGNGNNIGLCPRHPDNDPSQIYQRWYIYENDVGSGIYRLSPESIPTRSLDVVGANSADGTNIQLYDSNSSAAQKLWFTAFGGEILKGISCSETSLTLRGGESHQLSVQYNPSMAVPLNRRGIVWSSSDESVAAVDSNGLVTAYGQGSCTITATSAYNDLLSSTCTVTVEGGLQKPEITSLTTSGLSVHLSWSESPEEDENDVRAYEVFVCPKENTADIVWYHQDVRTTFCDIVLSERGEYTVYLRAVNKTDGSHSHYSTMDFTVFDDEWLYLDELPDNLADVEIQYLNRYEDREQEESPGEGWMLKESNTTYVDGDVLYYEVAAPLPESDTLAYLGTFYYHYCDGGNTVEHYPTDRFCYATHIMDPSQFDVAWQGTDDADPSYRVYQLKWNSGQWAGGLATCAHGSSALYYLGYSYRQRIPVTRYVWAKEAVWSDEIDPSADSVTYRVREIAYDNQLYLPAGTVRIEAEAFMNDTAIQEVFVPDGCVYIGSRAFAGCTELRRIHIPKDAVVEDDAFEGCAQLQIIRK